MKNVHLIETDKPSKETLEEAFKTLKEQYPILNEYNLHHLLQIARFGAKWQQEQDRNVYLNGYVDGSREQAKLMYSEEDMIEASKYGYNFYKTTQFPQQEFEDSCIRNTQQWLTTLKNK